MFCYFLRRSDRVLVDCQDPEQLQRRRALDRVLRVLLVGLQRRRRRRQRQERRRVQQRREAMERKEVGY